MKQSVSFVKVIFLSVLLSVLLFSSNAKSECKKVYGSGNTKIILATGSPGELGLLEALAMVFNKKHDTCICWRKAGSGKSLELLKEKKRSWLWFMHRRQKKMLIRPFFQSV